MFFERTSVGLDVHARSVVAEAIDFETGQVFSERLVPCPDLVVAWVGRLPGPVAVAYEAGPTGFGLARALGAAGIRCVVVAFSKLERPPGDRVKTDLLTELLRGIAQFRGQVLVGVATFPARDQVRGWAAGSAVVGGAALRVA
jgi:transposase